MEKEPQICARSMPRGKTPVRDDNAGGRARLQPDRVGPARPISIGGTRANPLWQLINGSGGIRSASSFAARRRRPVQQRAGAAPLPPGNGAPGPALKRRPRQARAGEYAIKMLL